MKKVILIVFLWVVFVVGVLSIFFLQFPKKYLMEIEEYSIKYSLPKSMIASVINIESGFDKSAKSTKGAFGLMQLTLSTAKECAEKLNLEKLDTNDLFDADINMELGCYYLRYLLDYFDGNVINCLCAYNWGLGNVNNWISDGNVDSSGTITNIPTKETRDYISKYRVNCFVYKNLYGYEGNQKWD